MNIKKNEIGSGVVVLQMTDRITGLRDCDRINQEIESLIRQNQTRVILDISGVHFIDSAAIGTIVKNFTLLKDSGGSLCMVGAKGMVKGVLEMTNIHKVIGIYATIQEACEAPPPPAPSTE